MASDRRGRLVAAGAVIALIGGVAAVAAVLSTGGRAPATGKVAIDAAPITTPEAAADAALPRPRKPARPVTRDQRQAMSFAARYRLVGARLDRARRERRAAVAAIARSYAAIDVALALRDPEVRRQALATLAEIERELGALD